LLLLLLLPLLLLLQRLLQRLPALLSPTDHLLPGSTRLQ
jgi:hypothetical protein